MDFSFITDFFDSINQFLQYAWDWLAIGIYEFVKECFVVMTKASIYAFIQGTIFLVDVAAEVVDVAAEVVGDISADLGVTRAAQSAYDSIPSDMRATLDFFGVPQALTIILAAIPTRMVMRFIPFIGR